MLKKQETHFSLVLLLLLSDVVVVDDIDDIDDKGTVNHTVVMVMIMVMYTERKMRR